MPLSESLSDNLSVEPLKLEPRAIFGFNGEVEFGLHLHPDKKHIIFPLGMKIGIANMHTNKQEFISGHTNNVSCLDVSRSGRYLASGQINHLGFRGYVIIWDYEARKEIGRHDLHKVRVQSICFTSADKYVVSIGGCDDGTVIVFDLETYAPICRSVAGRTISGNPTYVCPLNNNPFFFICAGDRHLRMWSIHREQKKLYPHDVNVGKQQRQYTRVRINKSDEFAYIGTRTGDVVKLCLNCCDQVNVTKPGHTTAMMAAFGKHNTRKPYGKDCDRYVNGVRDVYIVGDGLLLLGAGDGVVELVEERKDVDLSSFKDYPSPTWPMLRMLKHGKVNGPVSSMAPLNAVEYYICTEKNEIYQLNIKTFAMKLIKTCHQKPVYNIVFPKNLSSVFASAGYESIRVWSLKRLQELLRIMVYNFHCACIAFTNDGTSIISAWNDGVIRAFTPITGRLIYAIPNAHNKGCSALCVSSNGRMVVTGGIEGQVRVWKIEPYRQSLVGVLKDHSGPISSLDFNHLDTEVISACSDGSCVIWDVSRLSRKFLLTANTQFMTARYFPSGVQLLTCGSDGRISYWVAYNGSLIRELEGSKKSSVNCVTINNTGDYFVSVGSDQQVKLWDYNRGIVVCQGSEHASSVISSVFSPCGKFFVTGSNDGCIIIWSVPQQFWGKKNPPAVAKAFTKAKLAAAESKAMNNVKNPTNQKPENVEAIHATAQKGDVCCVECPPVNMRQKPDINENCNYIPDARKC